MRAATWLLFVSLGAALWPGCQCGSLNIGPTNLVAPGRYQGLWGFPWGNDQKYVIANKLDARGEAGSEITVFQVGEAKTCDLTVAQSRWFWSMGRSLFVLEAIDWNRWVGRLAAVELPCGPVRTLLENVYLTVWREPGDAAFYVLSDLSPETERGRLVRVDWPSGMVHEVRADIPSDGFSFDWPGRRFFYREAGRLVSTRLDGIEEGRLGDGVTRFVSSGTGEILFQEGGRLSRARVDGSEITPLSEDACQPGFVENWLTFLEPCSGSRQIVLLDRQTSVPRGRFGSAVARFQTWPAGWLSWQEAGPQEGIGPLWVKPPGADPVKVADEASGSWYILGEQRRVLHAVVTGPRTARLVSTDLATGASTVLAEGVDPDLPIAESPWDLHFAVVADLHLPEGRTGGDRVGTLALVHPVAGDRHNVAPVVPVRGFRFSWQAPAIGYLREFDPAQRAGTFEVLSMLDRKRFEVDHQVREFDEVFAPKRGVVYIILAPGREGIYFVEASVSLL